MEDPASQPQAMPQQVNPAVGQPAGPGITYGQVNPLPGNMAMPQNGAANVAVGQIALQQPLSPMPPPIIPSSISGVGSGPPPQQSMPQTTYAPSTNQLPQQQAMVPNIVPRQFTAHPPIPMNQMQPSPPFQPVQPMAPPVLPPQFNQVPPVPQQIPLRPMTQPVAPVLPPPQPVLPPVPAAQPVPVQPLPPTQNVPPQPSIPSPPVYSPPPVKSEPPVVTEQPVMEEQKPSVPPIPPVSQESSKPAEIPKSVELQVKEVPLETPPVVEVKEEAVLDALKPEEPVQPVEPPKAELKPVPAKATASFAEALKEVEQPVKPPESKLKLPRPSRPVEPIPAKIEPLVLPEELVKPVTPTKEAVTLPEQPLVKPLILPTEPVKKAEPATPTVAASQPRKEEEKLEIKSAKEALQEKPTEVQPPPFKPAWEPEEPVSQQAAPPPPPPKKKEFDMPKSHPLHDLYSSVAAKMDQSELMVQQEIQAERHNQSVEEMQQEAQGWRITSLFANVLMVLSWLLVIATIVYPFIGQSQTNEKGKSIGFTIFIATIMILLASTLLSIWTRTTLLMKRITWTFFAIFIILFILVSLKSANIIQGDIPLLNSLLSRLVF